MKYFILSVAFFCLLITSSFGQTKDYKQKAEQTDIANLPYDVSKIIVRGFDGSNPPPTMIKTDRPMLYGYGTTAYHLTNDSLIFFRILSMDAVHRDNDGNEISRHPIEKGRYSSEFKDYFLNKIPKEQRKNIWFENIYIKDKKENYLRLVEPQRFCPHCL